jgi:AbrB family looped-hinge helix DNA binding protein
MDLPNHWRITEQLACDIQRLDGAIGAGCSARRAQISKTEIAEKKQICNNDFMKAILTITSRGVVTLPAKLRAALGLKGEDQVIAETTPEGLLLRPAVTLPIEMYTVAREREFDTAEAELASMFTKQGNERKAVRRSSRTTRR